MPSSLFIGWGAYPPPNPLPLDADGFVIAFDPPDAENPRGASSAEALAFFREYGCVVWRNVLSEAECAATRDEVWTSLEGWTPGLRRWEHNTYHGRAVQARPYRESVLLSTLEAESAYITSKLNLTFELAPLHPGLSSDTYGRAHRIPALISRHRITECVECAGTHKMAFVAL